MNPPHGGVTDEGASPDFLRTGRGAYVGKNGANLTSDDVILSGGLNIVGTKGEGVEPILDAADVDRLADSLAIILEFGLDEADGGRSITKHHFNGEGKMIGLDDSRSEVMQDAGGRSACGGIGVYTYVVDLAALAVANEGHKAIAFVGVGVGSGDFDDVKHMHEMDERRGVYDIGRFGRTKLGVGVGEKNERVLATFETVDVAF